MQALLTELIDSAVSMPGRFADVAVQDPVSAILMIIGTLLVVISSGMFGYLTLGALVDLVMPDVSTQPPQAGR